MSFENGAPTALWTHRSRRRPGQRGGATPGDRSPSNLDTSSPLRVCPPTYDRPARREWPLTGRDGELGALIPALSANAAAAGVLLAGAAGVGKSRLAREAIRLAIPKGSATRWVTATASARTIPLGVFSDVVPSPRGLDSGLLYQVSAALTDGRQGDRVVIAVDDAHLLDDMSAAVVHQLAVAHAARLVITVRSGESAPDAVTALWKDGHLSRVEVPALSAGDTGALMEAVLGGPLESLSARLLYGATLGNVLFLRELVDGALESRNLRCTSGVWQWRRDFPATPRLVELVDARIGELSDPLRAVLEVLAFAEPLELRLLEQLTDSESIDEAEQRGLIRVETDGHRLLAHPTHPLYSEILRGRTSTLRARRLRGLIARVLAGTGATRQPDVLRRAVLLLDAEHPDPVVLTSAAAHATTLGDMPLAERLARAAITSGAGVEATSILGKVLGWQGEVLAAEQVLAALPDLADTDERRVLAAVSRAAVLFFQAGEPERARHVLGDALAVVRQPAARSELDAVDAVLLCFLNKPGEAITRARAVLASPLSDGAAVSWAVAALALSLAVTGHGDEVPELVESHSWAIESVTALPSVRYLQGLGELMALRMTGRLELADSVVARYADDATSSVWTAAMISLFRGYASGSAGLLGGAVRQLREAVAGIVESERAGRFPSLVGLTQAIAMTGDAAQARQVLLTAENSYQSMIAVFEPDLLLSRGWVAAAEGVTTEAASWARQAAALASGSGQLGMEVLALHSAVCFGDASVATRLSDLACVVDGPLAPIAAAHAAALFAGDGDALDAVSARLAELGALVPAADAAAQAASAHRRRGARGGEAASAALAQQLAVRCEGARTPELMAAARPLPLSKREREVALLVAAGFSNRDIADRLVISVRTIEGHVYRACAKLGVADRGGLAVLLRGTTGQGAGGSQLTHGGGLAARRAAR
jgi:DNA-binding CsgD family transcriptional regulator